MCDICCLIVQLGIKETVVFSIHTCEMGCGWPIYSNVFSKMMTYPPVKKHPPVYAYAAEAKTNFKMMLFKYTGPFRRSCAQFEGIIPKKKYPAAQTCDFCSVRYDA